MKGNEYIIIGILIIILIICIIIRRIKKQNQEQFRQLINRQIMESEHSSENENKNSNENVLETENQQINENEPNDILAYQSTAKLLQENENTKAHESFLFLDTPFKHSFNYIIITIQKLILKVFKTKSGYLITDKNVNNVYVPYENELKPIPFNPYTPIHKIPKYIYVNVVQSAPDLLCIRKGHCYYDRNLKAWKHYNKKRDKKYVKDMIEDLGRKIKHLENKAFNSVGATSARNTVPNNNPSPSFIQKSNSLSEDVQTPNININNKINLSKLPTIDENENNIKLNKIAVMEDAPIKDMNNYLNKNYNENISIATSKNKQNETVSTQDLTVSNNIINENIETQADLNNIKYPKDNEKSENKSVGTTSAKNNNIKNETEDIKKQLEEQQKQIKELQEQQQIKESEQIKEEPEPKPEDLLPKDETKETFWSRFGF